MRHAAEGGQLIMVRCGLCHHRANYWAQDLVKVVGPTHEVHVPPFPCSRCKTRDYIDVKCTVPPATELDGLTVRRPVRKVTKWIWRDEKA